MNNMRNVLDCSTGGVCHTYEWRTGGWRENERNVWCQRSDGVNVTGGCPSHTRPSAIRHCHPPCSKPFSFCTQSGVCGCEKGFTEVMTSHGFLDYCTRTPGPDHKKADVKTGSGQARPGRTQSQNPLREWALQAVGPDGRVRPWVYGLMAAGFVLILLIIIMSFLLWTPGPDHKKADVKTGSGQARPGRTQSQNPLREWALQAVGPDGRVRPWVYGLMAAGFVLILLIIIMSFLLCKNTKPSSSGGCPQKALTLSYDGDTDM
ncbi:hypothetical protein AALO_G00293620 [Alosa alosa]|uniref:Thrombospondin type-1 domain-containing protein n=1 Tax=Alosa alosa TaxID=278164 RepID=A0AAV6FHU2_9TELE|nr:hypothetical protein AALO_G00293620 [Alosa alosa]